MAPIRIPWHKRFNVDALVDEAQSIRQLQCFCDLNQKPMSGSSNYAIILIFEDGVEWVFRYPASVAGQIHPDPKLAKEMLASEVATMKCVREKTFVPVPEIFAYSLTKENPIGVPYILMSKAEGVQLKTLGWDIDLKNPQKDHLSTQQKSKIMRNLGEMVSKLIVLQFDKLGSVVENNGTYSVEECLAPPFIYHEREKLPNISRGPFNTAKEYYDALVDVYIRHLEELPLVSNVFFIKSIPKARNFEDWHTYASAFSAWADSTNNEHLSPKSLLDFHTAGHFMRQLTSDLEASCSTPRFSLYHNDLSIGNIFVDENLDVTCIIDWTNASTVPPATAYATPGLPQFRDGTEPYLDRSFRSSFIVDDESLWKRARCATLFTRLCLLDSGEEMSCFEELLTTMWGKEKDEIWSLFRTAQTTVAHLTELASDLAQTWDDE